MNEKTTSPKNRQTAAYSQSSKEVIEKIKEIRREVEKDKKLLSRFYLVNGGVRKEEVIF